MPASYELGTMVEPRPRDRLLGQPDAYEPMREEFIGAAGQEDADDIGQTPQTIAPPEAGGFSGGLAGYRQPRGGPTVRDGGRTGGGEWQPRGGGGGMPRTPTGDWPDQSPTGGGQDAGPQNWEDWLKDYSRDWLDNPSRWDQPLVQDTLDLIDARLADRRQEANNRINEQMSRRGLSRSSIAMSEFGEMEEDLERQRMQAANQLEQRIAQTLMEDRSRAFRNALEAGRFGLDKQSMSQNELAMWLQLAGAEGLSDDQKEQIQKWVNEQMNMGG